MMASQVPAVWLANVEPTTDRKSKSKIKNKVNEI